MEYGGFKAEALVYIGHFIDTNNVECVRHKLFVFLGEGLNP